jgi:60 kDa SS-A/Ro ribonucleoprotein
MKASEVSRRQPISKKADTTNNAGQAAFSLTPKEKLVQALTCGVLENSFYVSADKLFDQYTAMFDEWVKNDPKFLAQAIVHARNEGLKRSVPVMALAHLSEQETGGQEKTLFKSAFRKVVNTPNDLVEFVEYIRQSRDRGLGHAVDKMIAEYFGNLSEYHAIKYGSSGKGFSLRDVLRLVRPNPAKLPEKQQMILRWLVDKDRLSKEDYKKIPQILAYELFKESGDLKYALEGRLPYEVITAINSSSEAWEAIYHNAPIMNLIRNLRNFGQKGILDKAEIRNAIVKKLKNEEVIQKSKQFPFRFYSALRELERDPSTRKFNALQDALNQAMELAVKNIPELPGETYLSMDCSGSMHCALSSRSSLQYIEIGAILGACLLKRSSSNIVTGFANDCYPLRNYRASDSIATTAENIANITSGGTNLSSPIQYMIKNKIKVDQAILITDNESWLESSWGSRRIAADYIKDYHNKVKSDTKFFLIRLDPYGTSQVPPAQRNTYNLFGWSDSVVKFISLIANGGEKQIEDIESLELDS